MKGLAITGVIVLFLGIIGFGMYISYTNGEIDKRKRVEAQQETCKANYDKMFKVISQTAQVPQKFMNDAKEAFKEIYIPLMEGRYDNDRGGALMSWVTEHNPTFDLNASADMYKQLQKVIEANRQEYFVEQKKLIDMQRDHSTFIAKFPGRLFIGDVGEVDITIITSTQTENIYKDAKEDNINLFE